MILSEKHLADRFRFRSNHLRPKRLGAEYVRNKTEMLAKEREWRKLVGFEFWSFNIRPSLLCTLIRARRLRDKFRAARNGHRRKIGRRPDARRQAAQETGPRSDQNRFQNDFVGQALRRNCRDILP